MQIHLLTGFLGSGKTTAIHQAYRLLSANGIKTGIITNDQGSVLVDGNFFNNQDIPSRQVMNGCFCCNYNDLDANIESLIETNGTQVIFAESVGSCTDIVATVLRPLLRFRPQATTTVSTFADVRLLELILNGAGGFDESVRYIYLKQLEEAGIVVINKTDLVNQSKLMEIKTLMEEKFGGKELLYQNSMDPQQIKNWLDRLDEFRFTGLKPLTIDYDIYAEGEARLAWYDQELELYTSDNSALQQTEELINLIYEKIFAGSYSIGHLKFLVDGKQKVSFTSPIQERIALEIKPVKMASLLINIRVQVEPATMEELISEAIKEIEQKSGCKIITNSLSAFQPGYPRPTYRIE